MRMNYIKTEMKCRDYSKRSIDRKIALDDLVSEYEDIGWYMLTIGGFTILFSPGFIIITICKLLSGDYSELPSLITADCLAVIALITLFILNKVRKSYERIIYEFR